MAKNKLSKEIVSICPKCGSINVETDFSNPLNWAYGLPPSYNCNECGYRGKFFPQISIGKVKAYQSELRKGTKEGENSKEELKKNQKALAIFAAECAEHVLPYFERKYPEDKMPRKAVETLREWIKTGVFNMKVIRKASLDSHAAARKAPENSPARFAARAAGQAVATAHVPEHAFGASYYALKIAASGPDPEVKVKKELEWQSRHIPKNLIKIWDEWQARRLPKSLLALIKEKS